MTANFIIKPLSSISFPQPGRQRRRFAFPPVARADERRARGGGANRPTPILEKQDGGSGEAERGGDVA